MAGLIVALGATHLWWLLRFRRGFPVGYGGPSANTGSSFSPLSPGLWTHELRRAVNTFLFLPLAAVLILALAVGHDNVVHLGEAAEGWFAAE